MTIKKIKRMRIVIYLCMLIQVWLTTYGICQLINGKILLGLYHILLNTISFIINTKSLKNLKEIEEKT